MINGHFPPVSTFLLAGFLTAAVILTPLATTAPQTSGLGPQAQVQTATATTPTASDYWSGPRAETKREILIAPLFVEDRKLPAPFDNSPPEPEVIEAPVPEVSNDPDPLGMNPPEETPVETIADEEVVAPIEEQIEEQSAEPLVLPDLRLVGTFIVEDRGIARALLMEITEGAEEVWINENDFYEDWQLTIVSPEAVRLVAGEESLTLELWEDDLSSDRY
ncbi:MAG: hypothetical protein AAGA50_26730 [Pseudomonadota bacterium]